MYYFIVNPISGCGRGKKIWKSIQEKLEQLSVTYEAFLLRYEGEAQKIANSLSKLQKPFTLVVVGGDGTLSEVFDGLSSFEYVTLGCIPTGSGNDFMRGLGLRKSPLDALHMILNPTKIRNIKIGTVSSVRPDASSQENSLPQKRSSFGVSSGIGFDAAVCNGAYQSGLKTFLNWFHLGKLVYTGTALKQLFASRLCPAKLILDDETVLSYDKLFFAAAMNMPYEGGGFMFAPNAVPDSGTFILCIAEGLSKPRILTLLPLAFAGKHVGKRGIHLIPCKKAEIHTQIPLCVHTDGEVYGFCDAITFEAQKELLSVIVG